MIITSLSGQQHRDHITGAALLKLDIHKHRDWDMASSECIGDDFLVEVSQVRPKKSGKNKGALLYFGVRRRVMLSRAELDAHHALFEKVTGDCHECYGRGKTVWKSGPKGTEYNICKRCRGTGKAP